MVCGAEIFMDLELPLHFDANSSAGVEPAVLAETLAILPAYQNGSAIHGGGQKARILIEAARAKVCRAAGAGPGDLCIFTSGATESNTLAIYSILQGAWSAKDTTVPINVVISGVEHPSIYEALGLWRERGIEVRVVNPDAYGVLHPSQVTAAVDRGTALVSIMTVNNETGQIFPISTISAMVRECNPLVVVHTDAVQAFGRIEWSLPMSGADMVTISGHKAGALPGVGALLVRSPLQPRAILCGGPQEGGHRAGTENLIGIVSFGIVARRMCAELTGRVAHLRVLRDAFKETLAAFEVTVAPELRWQEVVPSSPKVAHTLSMRIPRVLADDFVIAADIAGVWLAAGAACSSGKPGPSPVLLALGMTEEHARETVRISFGASLTESDVRRGAKILVTVANRLQAQAGATTKELYSLADVRNVA